MIGYMVVNIRPNKLISPSFEVWAVSSDIKEAEKTREKWLQDKHITLDPENFQVIQFNNVV